MGDAGNSNSSSEADTHTVRILQLICADSRHEEQHRFGELLDVSSSLRNSGIDCTIDEARGLMELHDKVRDELASTRSSHLFIVLNVHGEEDTGNFCCGTTFINTESVVTGDDLFLGRGPFPGLLHALPPQFERCVVVVAAQCWGHEFVSQVSVQVPSSLRMLGLSNRPTRSHETDDYLQARHLELFTFFRIGWRELV
jgi:hypothetical protein